MVPQHCSAAKHLGCAQVRVLGHPLRSLSHNALAQVTFDVSGTDPVVFIATDRNYVSELITIFDSTGTTVGESSQAPVCELQSGDLQQRYANATYFSRHHNYI